MKSPDVVRPFATPLVPLVPILGMIICSGLIYSLDPFTQFVAFAWMAMGLFIYFGYSKKNSHLQNR